MIHATLVTIHGFWSTPATWERLNAIWYADEQLRGLRIYPFSYPSPKKPQLPFSTTRVPDYDDVAQTLATWYRVRLGGERDIVIVTHSQGGLIMQRFLTRMVHEGHGRELARIRSVVMLTCPNSGSEYLRSLRHVLGFARHAQAGNLEVLDKQVADTHRTVLQRIANATGVEDHHCRIPFHVYAGNSDKIVTAASAQGAFPGASGLAGNHFSILDPTAPGNITAETVKYHVLADLAASRAQPPRQIPSLVDAAPAPASALPAAGERRTAEKFRVDERDSQDVIIGHDAAVRRAQQQAARDRVVMQARQDELNTQLASLSEQARQLNTQLASLSERARQLEASTTRRINAATAAIMNEAGEANRQLRAETRQLPDQQEQRLDAALTTERAQRQREVGAVRTEVERDRATKASVLESARTAVADARVLHDAIGSSLPHERFAPGRLARLTDRLAVAEANVAAGTGETVLAQAQELYLSLGELRAEVQLKDAEWRAAHLAAVAAVTALAEQIRHNSMITVTDEDSGASAELDVDYWSEGELSAIRAEADQLAARVNTEADPPSLAELRDISERSVASLDDRLSGAVTTARTSQWASQVRVNMAAMVVDLLEETTGYIWDGDATFAGDDQRNAFYSKLKHPDESEIVVKVAPDEDGKSCIIRVMSYETGNPDESQRVARVQAIADSLREQGLSGASVAGTDEPDPRLRDFARIRQRQTVPASQERT